MLGAGGPVPVPQKDAHAVAGIGTQVDADAISAVRGPGHRFVDAVKGIESGGTHPPGHRELIDGTDLGPGPEVYPAPQGEVAGGSEGRVVGGHPPGDAGGVDEDPIIPAQGVDDGVAACGRIIKGIVGNQVGRGRRGAETEKKENAGNYEAAQGPALCRGQGLGHGKGVHEERFRERSPPDSDGPIGWGMVNP